MRLQDDLKGKKMKKNDTSAGVESVFGRQRMKEERRPSTLMGVLPVCGVTTATHPDGNTITCFQPVLEQFNLMGQDEKHLCIRPPPEALRSGLLPVAHMHHIIAFFSAS